MKQNYTSQVKLQSGEIGDDFAYYFLLSEQVPTIVSVGVLVDTDCTVSSSGAMIIELLPDHKEEDITYLENLNLKPISSVFLENPDIHKYLYELFPDAQILEERYVEYHCDCSRERFMRNFLTLPMKDLEEIAQEEDVEVKCEFCNKSYHFNQDDMKTIMSYANKR